MRAGEQLRPGSKRPRAARTASRIGSRSSAARRPHLRRARRPACRRRLFARYSFRRRSSRGFILPSLVVSYAHTEADIDLTIEAIADALVRLPQGARRRDRQVSTRPPGAARHALVQLSPRSPAIVPGDVRHLRRYRRLREVDPGTPARAAPRRFGPPGRRHPRAGRNTARRAGTGARARRRGMTSWAEAAFFAAARAELAERVIRPALANGSDVLCDRYLDSSLVYQGLGRGLGIEQVLELNVAVRDLVPDRTFVLLSTRRRCGASGLGARPDRARGGVVPRSARRGLPRRCAPVSRPDPSSRRVAAGGRPRLGDRKELAGVR